MPLCILQRSLKAGDLINKECLFSASIRQCEQNGSCAHGGYSPAEDQDVTQIAIQIRVKKEKYRFSAHRDLR